MSGDSNLGLNHWVFNSVKAVLGVVSPILSMIKKDAYNSPEVPAKAIADMFEVETKLGGKYFVLDDEIQSSEASLGVSRQEQVWEKICGDLAIRRDI
jgi:hypothetical protein